MAQESKECARIGDPLSGKMGCQLQTNTGYAGLLKFGTVSVLLPLAETTLVNEWHAN